MSGDILDFHPRSPKVANAIPQTISANKLVVAVPVLMRSAPTRVPHIVGVRAKVKVLWIYAQLIVALVKHKAVARIAFMEHP